MQPTLALPVIAGGLFVLIWLLAVVGGVIGYLIILLSVWRAMKAHQSIASALKTIARTLGRRPGARDGLGVSP